ncbi:coiled-coil domain containing protein 151 [Lycorma delicatula]|uniref:coiled-coil domain containing protein 151 n=1 Tax=Lycorma delicatula TaxID=130591 RepID=UPI003F514AFD
MPLQKEDPDRDLAVVNRQILEIKKKIQLSEGRRKAYYEECDAEKKRNIEKIRNLKKSVKELYAELAKPADFQNSEIHVKTGIKYSKETATLRNKDPEEAAQILDYKVIDLQKKLDLLHHEKKKYQEEMKKLAEKYQTLVLCSITDPRKKRREPAIRIISNLENQIHRIEMNQMEADHMRKKYCSIRSSLLQDGVAYESTLKKLEEDLLKQESEIQHLEGINKEAIGLRESTKGLLMRQEMIAMNAAKSRDRQMQELRQRVEDRKIELERLERRIFPSSRAVIHQDSTNSTDANYAAGEEAAFTTEELDKAFATLKEATGVTATEDVLDRFLRQKETKTRLTYLKETTEEEKKDLEKRRDMMMAELEAFKFAEVKDKEQNEEEVEKVKLGIEAEIEQKLKLDEEADERKRTLIQIKCRLYKLCLLLKNVNEEPVPDQREDDEEGSEEVLALLIRKLESALNIVDELKKKEEEEAAALVAAAAALEEDEGVDLEAPVEPEDLKLQLEEEILFPMLLESRAEKVSEPEDEEEIPTRGFLKRQAQVIVDAKSRRKGFRVATPRNFGKMK